MPSLQSHLHLEIENNYCLSESGKLCVLNILQNWQIKTIEAKEFSVFVSIAFTVQPLLVSMLLYVPLRHVRERLHAYICAHMHI